MNSFLATTPVTAAAETGTILNDGWFPDIDLQQAREAMRLDGTVTDVRLKESLIAALLDTNRALTAWQQLHQAAGVQKLADVPASGIDGKSRLLALYRRAVHSLAKADLIERYRDYDTTADGNRKAELLDPQIDDQRRNAHWALADIVGRPRLTVELI